MKKQFVILILTVVVVNCGWLRAGIGNNPADINNDYKVDLGDLAIFAANWLWEPKPDPSEFAYIPAGTFEMGDHHDGMSFSLPIHTVTLDSFYMSKYETTNQQYCDYLNSAYPAQLKVDGGVIYAADDTSNSFPYCSTSSAPTSTPHWGGRSQINYIPSTFSVNIKDGTTDMSDHPLVVVTWYGSVAYCNWKSQQEELESCYDLSTWDCDFTKNGFRLATEAEWEYAARGGSHNPYYRYPWGDSIDRSMANYWDSRDPYESATGAHPFTTPVGYYDGDQTPAGVDMANGYGLYDMAGNVYEWCNDWFHYQYYSISPTNNPTGPASSTVRVLRGSSWESSGTYCRVAERAFEWPSGHRPPYGFRVVVIASH